MLYLSISIGLVAAIGVFYTLYKMRQNSKNAVTKVELENLQILIKAESVLLINKILTTEKIRQINDPTLYVSPCETVKVRFRIFDKKSRDIATFSVSVPIYSTGSNSFFVWDYPNKETSVFSIGKNGDATPQTLALRDALYSVKGCVELHISPYEVRFQKSSALSWEELIPQINTMIFQALGTPIRAENAESVAAENEVTSEQTN